MTSRNFGVKLTPSPLSHIVTNVGPPTELTSQACDLPPFKKAYYASSIKISEKSIDMIAQCLYYNKSTK